MRHLLRAAAIGTWFAVTAFPQPGSILFGDIELRIGMAKPEVTAKLEATYFVTKITSVNEQTDMWLVAPRAGNSDEGIIQFQGDKLSSISRTLGRMYGGDIARTMGELFHAFHGVSAKTVASDDGTDPRIAQAEVRTRVSAIRYGEDGKEESKVRTLDFQAGGKTIELSILEPIEAGEGRSPLVQIREFIDNVKSQKAEPSR